MATAAAAFQVGDIVQLKSGGPAMTVKERSADGYHCHWFAGKKLESGYFKGRQLDPASAAPTIPPPGTTGKKK